jgi:16S rRNA (guanine527-N7)-methyltransferase
MPAEADASLGNGIHWRLPEWFPSLNSTQLGLLKQYFQELIKFNKTINLVSSKTIPFADVIHFADCIEASKLIFEKYQPTEVWDFGSGNGFPGIVFAILQPNIRFVLLDSDVRKTEFLKTVVQNLGLKNVEVKAGSIENLKDGTVKFCVSRGLSVLSKAILQARKVVPKGGIYCHLKSEEWGKEIADIPTQLCSFWSPGLLGEYRLPIGEVKFSVVITERLSN